MNDVLKECKEKMNTLHNNMTKYMGILDFYNQLDNEDRSLNNAIDAYTDNLNKNLKENIGQEKKYIISEAINVTDESQLSTLEPLINIIDEEFMKWYLIEWENIDDIIKLYNLLKEYDKKGDKFKSLVFILNSDIYYSEHPKSLTSFMTCEKLTYIINILGLNYTKFILHDKYIDHGIYKEILLQLHKKSHEIDLGRDIHIDILNKTCYPIVEATSHDNVIRDGIPGEKNRSIKEKIKSLIIKG